MSLTADTPHSPDGVPAARQPDDAAARAESPNGVEHRRALAPGAPVPDSSAANDGEGPSVRLEWRWGEAGVGDAGSPTMSPDGWQPWRDLLAALKGATQTALAAAAKSLVRASSKRGAGSDRIRAENWPFAHRVPLWLYLPPLAGSLGFTLFVFRFGDQGLVGDAQEYYGLAGNLTRTGLFDFASNIRTYGYPLFLAMGMLISGTDGGRAYFTTSAIQWLLYVGVCAYAARVFRRLFKSTLFAWCVFTVLVLNPYALIGATEYLSDLLSAVSVLLVYLLALDRASPASQDKRTPPATYIGREAKRVLLICVCVGVSAMIRPTNLIIALPIVIVSIWRIFDAHRRSQAQAMTPGNAALLGALAVLGLAMPLVPQVVNNHRVAGQVHPFTVRPRYQQNVSLGLLHLKYATVVIPEERRRLATLVYVNPLLPSRTATYGEFFNKSPFGSVGTLLLHGFALLDPDLPLPYVLDRFAWYRWPSSILGFVVLGLSGLGTVRTLRRGLPQRPDGPAGSIGAAVAVSACYIAAYLPVRPEVRYGLPVYLLLSPAFVYGLADVCWAMRSHAWRDLRTLAVRLGVFVAVCVAISMWIERQVQFLR